jgi:L-threonylcarbamoyladenylate synthase
MEQLNDDLQKAHEVLKAGGIIVYPTDTVWGIGCDATNAEAVNRLYEIKKRSDSKTMLVLLDAPGKLNMYVREVPDIAWDLIDLSVKPLTIIYDGARNLAPNLIAEDGSIGIRITNETFSKKLIERFKKPLVSTSANFNEKSTPALFSEIDKELLKLVDYVVQYRQNDKTRSKPSGIVRVKNNGEIKVIRE